LSWFTLAETVAFIMLMGGRALAARNRGRISDADLCHASELHRPGNRAHVDAARLLRCGYEEHSPQDVLSFQDIAGCARCKGGNSANAGDA
jgi:hypothetical protein